MLFSKQLSHVLEQQQMRAERKFYVSVSDMNLKLAKIHQQLKKDIDLQRYRFATEYIEQYIAHTTVWQLKFVQNIENPEVALMQIFHLNYIFQQEPEHKFEQLRQEFESIAEQFFVLGTYTPEHIEKRLVCMLEYIHSKENA